MSPQDAIEALHAVIDKERADGCPMAADELIRPALRRWLSYDRRARHCRDRSAEHRICDLEKGLIAGFPDYSYDPACIRHLAESFAEVLARVEVERLREWIRDNSD